MPRRLNCWIVAMMFWIHTHGREYAWVRRSKHFLGLIPHFGYAERVGPRSLKVIEYVPGKYAKVGVDGNIVALFHGKYRVTHLRIESINNWTCKEDAEKDLR